MFKKILIANRGEIALRIIHACRELGIPTVAVYSTADRDSLHVNHADEAICIGPPQATASYLNMANIIAAAENSGADAVHPGYGFLAENAHFAELVEGRSLTWIGPRSKTVRLLGDKAQARRAADAAGVPIVPGNREPLPGSDVARATAAAVGYPVILKAVSGGGGRGMRVVECEADLEHRFMTAQEEAQKAFGDGSIYLEKYLEEPRHIEFQIFGDQSGNVLHLGERECSIQRRHQKLLEEAPATALTPELRQTMGEAAIRLASALDYENAGTVEFLLDRDGSFFFMEMNTRIQVEHPVTEMVTGFDLVKLQIQIAAGEPLGVPTELGTQGHAIECRINAEDPQTFMPSPGKLRTFRVPGGPGVRVDTHGYEDYVFPPFYDSLLAKLVASGRDRREAIARMSRALDSFVVEGIKTTIPLHKKLMADADFVSGELSTHFMDRFLARPE